MIHQAEDVAWVLVSGNDEWQWIRKANEDELCILSNFFFAAEVPG